MDEIGHFLLKQYVYGILASSNAVSTDITYYYNKTASEHLCVKA